MSFVKRKIRVTFSMASGVSKTVEGLRTSVQYENAGDPSLGTANITIFGMALSDMNALSTVGRQFNLAMRNFAEIYAVDEESGMKLLMRGTIKTAFVDANAQPDVAFRVLVIAGHYEAMQPIEPTSKEGGADVKQIVKEIAGKIGLQTELPSSLNIKLSNPYLPRSGLEQIRSVMQAAGLNWTVENDTIVAVKPGQTRAAAPVIASKNTGMIGYPAFNEAMVIVTMLFNPDLKMFGSLTVESELTPANGTWVITRVDHNVEAETPNGAWQTTATCTVIGGQAGVAGSAF